MESIKAEYGGDIIQLAIEPIWKGHFLVVSGYNETKQVELHEDVLGIMERFYQPQIKRIRSSGTIGHLGFSSY